MYFLGKKPTKVPIYCYQKAFHGITAIAGQYAVFKNVKCSASLFVSEPRMKEYNSLILEEYLFHCNDTTLNSILAAWLSEAFSAATI